MNVEENEFFHTLVDCSVTIIHANSTESEQPPGRGAMKPLRELT